MLGLRNRSIFMVSDHAYQILKSEQHMKRCAWRVVKMVVREEPAFVASVKGCGVTGLGYNDPPPSLFSSSPTSPLPHIA